MKTLKLTLFAVAATFMMTFSATAQEKKAEVGPTITTTPAPLKPTTPVKWKEDSHDFGEIKKGTPVTNDFTFVNTTKQTILISNVKPSCGCTAANYTKTPIKPGDSGSISATYNAASPGAFSKSITVNFNEGENPKILTIKGKVIDDAPINN